MLHRWIALAFALGAVPLASASTNLLSNASFDSGISGWSSPRADLVSGAWQKFDAAHAATSGSIAVTTNFSSVNGGGMGMRQCVALTPGQTYDMSVNVMVLGGNQATGQIAAFMYPTSDCSGDMLDIGGWGSRSVSEPSNGGFTPVSRTAMTFPAEVHSVFVTLFVVNDVAGPVTVHFDDAFFGTTGGCVPDDLVACLDGGRFAVSATFATAEQQSGWAHMVRLTPDTATMWFFDKNNVEITIKVLNACTVSANHWVFSSGLTNVRVSITVKDTVSGTVRVYDNPLGTSYQPNFDTAAFACP